MIYKGGSVSPVNIVGKKAGLTLRVSLQPGKHFPRERWHRKKRNTERAKVYPTNPRTKQIYGGPKKSWPLQRSRIPSNIKQHDRNRGKRQSFAIQGILAGRKPEKPMSQIPQKETPLAEGKWVFQQTKYWATVSGG